MNGPRNKTTFLQNERGTAVIETAILMPLYMIILFSLLFLGYLTLGQHREIQAAAYAGWAAGTQGSEDLLETFFPWVYPDGGSGDGAGDAETRLEVISDAVDPDTTVDSGRFEDYIAVLALGEAYQSFTFGSGGVTSNTGLRQTEFGKYLSREDFNRGDGYRESTLNSSRLTDSFNGLGTTRWMEIHTTNLSYTFKPVYFRWVHPEGELTEEEYLINTPEESSDVPTLERSFRVVTRGAHERRAARDPGGSVTRVMGDMNNLMGRDLDTPMDASQLNNMAGVMFGDGLPLYVAR